MARRGRPKGGDSTETRQRIILAARDDFAARGFDGASVATIAAKSDLAPSAVYHYFGSKVALYEEVYTVSTAAVWDAVREAGTAHPTLVENVQAMVDFATNTRPELRPYSHFLALTPLETTLHPEFAHLRSMRTKWQDETFGALAELGIETGELAGLSTEIATEMLRSLLMGWFLESYYRGKYGGVSADAVVAAVKRLTETPSSQRS